MAACVCMCVCSWLSLVIDCQQHLFLMCSLSFKYSVISPSTHTHTQTANIGEFFSYGNRFWYHTLTISISRQWQMQHTEMHKSTKSRPRKSSRVPSFKSSSAAKQSKQNAQRNCIVTSKSIDVCLANSRMQKDQLVRDIKPTVRRKRWTKKKKHERNERKARWEKNYSAVKLHNIQMTTTIFITVNKNPVSSQCDNAIE